MADGLAAGEGAGPAKVRVVRCPKCQKLLPELAGFTVYRCGGCDTTLRAKPKPPVAGPDSSSLQERIILSECADPMAGTEIDHQEREKMDVRRRQRQPEGTSSCGSAASATGKCGLPSGRNRHRDGGFMRASKAPACTDDTPKSNAEEENRENKLAGERTYRSHKPMSHLPLAFKDEERKTPRVATEGTSRSGPGNVESLEQDRAVLLQKLDELRDQLSRSCDVKGKTSESRRTVSSSSYDTGNNQGGAWLKSSSSVNRAAAARQFPIPAGHDVESQGFYPPPHARSEMHHQYGDLFEHPPPVPRRGHYHGLHQYPQRASDGYLYGQFDPEAAAQYRHDGFYHQPACSYSHCYDMPWHEQAPPPPPPPPPPPLPHARRGGYHATNSHSLYPVDDQFLLRSGGYNRRAQQRAMPPRWGRHSYKPLSGGAPFIICPNCSELLHVSPHLLAAGKTQHKLRCGSCSEVISFKVDGTRLNVGSPPSAAGAPLEHRENSEELMAQGLLRLGSRNCDHFSGNVPSTDEKLVLSSPVPHASQETIEKDYGLNLSESENMLGLGSPSSSSDGIGNTESMVCHRDVPSSPDLQDPMVSGLPLRDHFGYSPSDQLTGKPGEGSRSKRFDQEKMVEINDNFHQTTIKDVAVNSDVESAISDPLNLNTSQDSGEISKEEDRPRAGKGGDSFFAGFIKKKVKDLGRFNHSSDGSKFKVSVNGHQIPDRVVKRAEKMAGPIHPGDYWYDHEAGFWGVMGHPCLGIIPPFIEEFNYPMPKNCSGGNTGVTVNGRELHQKDLDLLVGRGLPPEFGRSYRIDITGKVLDDASGEELDSLGKLAPTVEKVRHGFGMRVPRTPVGAA